MPRRVQAVSGVKGLTLPGGWALNGGDMVVIPDEEWDQIVAGVETLGHLIDLGDTADAPDPVPTFRDFQRAVAGGPTGLEAEVDALDAALSAHVADTTGVHGVVDTSKLGWNQDVDVAAAAPGNVLTKTAGGLWVGAAPAPAGGAYQHVQSTPAAEWTVAHNLGRYPSMVLRLASAPGEPVHTDITYVDENTALVTWPSPESGWADTA